MAKNESNYTPISINRSNKLRLQNMKGRLSFDEYVGKILDFVEVSGVDVNTPAVPAQVAIKDQANRIIEVMRGIEKTQNKMILNIQNVLFNTEIQYENQNPEFMERTEEVAMLFDQHKQLVQEHSTLNESFEKVKKENETLNKKLKDAPAAANADSFNVKMILEIIEEIDDRKNTNTFNPNNYEISKSEFDGYMSRLKKELKK